MMLLHSTLLRGELLHLYISKEPKQDVCKECSCFRTYYYTCSLLDYQLLYVEVCRADAIVIVYMRVL